MYSSLHFSVSLSLVTQFKLTDDKHLSHKLLQAHLHSMASLEGRGLLWDHDSGFHFLNKRDCIIYQFFPAMFMPCCIPYIFPGLKILVSPKMVHHIELPNLGEEPSNCFITVLSEANGSSPVIAPFNHSSWSELVGSEFIYVRS